MACRYCLTKTPLLTKDVPIEQQSVFTLPATLPADFVTYWLKNCSRGVKENNEYTNFLLRQPYLSLVYLLPQLGQENNLDLLLNDLLTLQCPSTKIALLCQQELTKLLKNSFFRRSNEAVFADEDAPEHRKIKQLLAFLAAANPEVLFNFIQREIPPRVFYKSFLYPASL